MAEVESTAGAHIAGECVVEARGLRKSYFRAGRTQGRNFDAVATCDLALSPGQLVACMGRSGSGKTTLLTMLAGLLAPSEGTVRLAGQDLYALPDEQLSRLRNERVGVVPQGQTVLHTLTALQNVMLPCGLWRRGDVGPGPADFQTRAEGLMGRLGIDELANAYPEELSGGELRRVAIARSLIMGPAVVFADEPTSDLDDQSTSQVLGLLREVADAGASVFVVSHESEVTDWADRVVHMDAGVLRDGTDGTE